MTFNIKEESDQIVVFVEIPHNVRKNNAVPRQRIVTDDVTKILSERGIEHGNVIQEADIKNWAEQRRRGTWIFEKKIEKLPVEKKIEKPLDKTSEYVILSKEEKPAPKKRKTRAKKKTSK